MSGLYAPPAASYDMAEDGLAKHVAVSTKMMSQGSRVSDGYSTGMKADVASDRDLPYKCEVCACVGPRLYLLLLFLRSALSPVYQPAYLCAFLPALSLSQIWCVSPSCVTYVRAN